VSHAKLSGRIMPLMKTLILCVTAAGAVLPAPAPFQLTVPGVTATGSYEAARLAVTVEVTHRRTCGVLQLKPAGGEWGTVSALCNTGTADLRLPLSAGPLPSIRVCNGDSIALAEGVDCDDHTPAARVTTRG
jgi:hypothetical protein